MSGLFGRLLRLPWWFFVLLGGIWCLVFGPIANSDMVSSVFKRYVEAETLELLLDIIEVSYYLVPAICLLLAGATLFVRRQRKVVSHHQRRLLDGMNRSQFNALLIEAFKRRGYKVTLVQTGSELLLEKQGRRYLAQSTAWRDNKVGVSTVRELHWAMVAEGIQGGFVISAGVYSSNADRFAHDHAITLIDGRALRKLLHGITLPSQLVLADASNENAPPCPGCGGDMVQRIANKGANVGEPFWGCMRYPVCCGVQVVE
ncbi:restriction endonuclease [Chitinimonas sp. PSY-7]|uniref:restriction endonuclease n=1 Tax=Chitinimonas sp. PSY-7 TaxID=3459088 RepID=UPI00403FCF38